MDQDPESLLKHREIRFFSFKRPEPDMAQPASEFLKGVHGIHQAEPVAPLLLNVSYDIRHVTLEEIEYALKELGYHLDGSLLSAIKRALYYYTEETQRANLGIAPGSENMQVFINRYQRIQHGCRDERPEHWRSYL